MNCTNIASYYQMNQNSKDFYNSEEIVKCYKDCPIECNIDEYELSSSHAAYPNELYEKFIRDFFDYMNRLAPQNSSDRKFDNLNGLKKRSLALNVVSAFLNILRYFFNSIFKQYIFIFFKFYRSTSYYNIQEYPAMTLAEMMSEIG